LWGSTNVTLISSCSGGELVGKLVKEVGVADGTMGVLGPETGEDLKLGLVMGESFSLSMMIIFGNGLG
jgi:hypothetical protein